MIALVRGVMAASIRVGSILNVAGSMSTKTFLAPRRAIEPAVAKNVYGLVITSSPAPMSRAISDNSRASVPELTPTQFLAWQYAATAFSSCPTSGPLMHCCDSSTRSTAGRISSRRVAY